MESTLDAILLTGQLEGVIIDPVYEGKSMAGLIDLVTSGEIPKHATVLYAHLVASRPSTPTAACSPTPTRSPSDVGADTKRRDDRDELCKPSVVAVPIIDGGPDYLGWILATEQRA